MTPQTYRRSYYIGADHPQFEGHFPGHPILPAVAQVEMALWLLAEELGVPVQMVCVKRAKFKAILRPNTAVELEVTREEEHGIRWTLRDQEQVYSLGQIQVHF